MKRYAAYKPTGLKWFPEIPQEWNWRFLCQVAQEQTIKKPPEEMYPVMTLSYGEIKRKKNIDSGLVPSNYDNYQMLYKGNIVLRLIDLQNDHTSLRTGLVHETGIITSAYTCIVSSENSAYIRYLLHSYDTRKVFYGYGGGVRQSIGFKEIRHLQVSVPPRDEQDQIVRYLDWQVSKINRLIAAKRKQIELMKDNLKSAVAKLTTHGIGSHDMCRSEIYWLTEYPSTWHVTKLKYILKKHRREVPPNAELLICSNSGEVTKRGDGKLGLVAASDDIYQGVKTGDLLIHGMDTWHGAIAISNFDGMCTPVVHVCTCREEKRFVAYYLKMMAYTKVFKAISNGVRQNTSDFRSWDKVGDLLICLPDISEQVAIADELDKLTDATKKGIACFERHIEKLVDLRTRLISDVVTGQIDVRGIEVPDYEHYDEAPENATEESSDSDYDTEE